MSSAWMSGIIAGINGKKGALSTKIANIEHMMGGNSPPPEGPLRNIDKGGENVGKAWIKGMADGISDGARMLGSVLMPSLGGAAVSSAPALTPAISSNGSGSGVGDEVHVHIHGNVYGGPTGLDQLARDIEQRLRQTTRGALRQAGSF